LGWVLPPSFAHLRHTAFSQKELRQAKGAETQNFLG